MNRMYRGWTKEGKCVKGWYVEFTVEFPNGSTATQCTIVDNTGKKHTVIKETVGQSTGLFDKNGVEIFEGDIVKAYSQGSRHIGEIRWRDSTCGACPCYIIYPAYYNGKFWHLNGGEHQKSIEIIGNIHENPEMLKESKE